MPEFDTHKQTMITQIVGRAQQLFDSQWKTDSVWYGLENLLDTFSDFIPERQNFELAPAFYFQVIDFLDSRDLDKLGNLLNELNLLMPATGNRLAEILKSKVLVISEKLELDAEMGENLVKKISSLEPKKQDAILVKLEDLSAFYQKIAVNLKLIFSALSLYTYSNTPTTVAGANNILDKLIKADSQAEKIPLFLVLFRYLGQGVFGHDHELGMFAYEMLEMSEFKNGIPDDFAEKLHIMLLIYLAFAHFGSLNLSQQGQLIKNYSAKALIFGVPVKIVLQPVLAGQINLVDYLNICNAWSTALENSSEAVIFSGKILATGMFIKTFLNYAQDKKGLNLGLAKQFISQWSKENKLNSAEEWGEKILDLYIGLANANIIDYRGLLSETGEMPLFDWDKVMAADLNEEKILEIKNYLRLAGRPFWQRIKIINAWQKLPWDEEPYIWRVVEINAIYEELYGDFYGPLMFFNEETDKWELNIVLAEQMLPKIQQSVEKFGVRAVL